VSVNVDIEEFRVQAWNDFVRLIGTINSINSGWVGWNACGSHVNTFYGFMQSREDEWVDEDGDDVWEFSAPSLQNRLGL
jgi:hypothetical protein